MAAFEALVLFATLPKSDRGKRVFAAFGSAFFGGPVAVSIHAVLGVVLVIAAISRAGAGGHGRGPPAAAVVTDPETPTGLPVGETLSDQCGDLLLS